MRRTNLTIAIWTLFAVACTLVACNRNAIYSHYEHTPISGWEKNDTITFGIPPVAESGDYHEELGLRINGDYPFLGLSLVIEQTVLPSGYRHNDTLNCSLIDDNGRVKGAGIRHYQYNFHVNTIRLNEGDSLHVLVKHNMKREIMTGITDIGIHVEKN
ncbi:MAG: gliding motility lipoprotein GldH [Prevotella sp.]|nr:gliding motility lipoprotein GldH [Prevotella sp.]